MSKCDKCGNDMKEHVKDGGKSITLYCDCEIMVPLDEVIEIIENYRCHDKTYERVGIIEQLKQKYIKGRG